MRMCNKKLAGLSTLVFIVAQFRILSWAVSVHHKQTDSALAAISTATSNNSSSVAQTVDYVHLNEIEKHLPTLYEYYTQGGIKSGLVATSKGFLLNGKPLRIISGAIHYFRVHPAYWRDRLRKLRASGANAVETYVAWNLHEPQQNQFDFGKGNNDMSIFLDLVTYLQIAYEEDLLVLLRPGPYICSEWDFGGLPSWLLRDPTMHVRTSYGPYIERVDNFFKNLIPLVRNMQFTSAAKNNPIIAVQVENEYGSFGYEDQPRDQAYLQHLADKIKELGITELLFTSDSPARTFDWGAIPGVLQTANFQSNAAGQFKALESVQPNMPLMVAEFWSGWFDHWTQSVRFGLSLANFESNLDSIFKLGASVSFYMFHGGTNFGFMNGANVGKGYPGNYLPDITSYDYGAPLSEAGDYTEKYYSASRLISTALSVKTRLPQRPVETLKRAYKSIVVEEYLSLNSLLSQVDKRNIVTGTVPLSMENLPINNMNGQSYGFVVYRHHVMLKNSSQLKIRGHIRDFAQVLVNGKLQTPPVKTRKDLEAFGSWCPRDSSFKFGSWKPLEQSNGTSVMDIVVENLGRVNYGEPHNFIQKKGLWEGPVSLDGITLSKWIIYPLEFKQNWILKLKNWVGFDKKLVNQPGPLLVRATLIVEEPIADTFIDMSSWEKGVVFVNGFNLGRYWTRMGPQKALYLPAPLLKAGKNTIMIYEQYAPSGKIWFSDKPMLGEMHG